MQLRWSTDAAEDLERIADYLFENTPHHALRLVRQLYNAPNALIDFPSRGRPGRKPGTRELVLSPLPYLMIYTVSGEVIHLVRILHGAQKWPSTHSP